MATHVPYSLSLYALLAGPPCLFISISLYLYVCVYVIYMEIGGHPPIPLAQNNYPLWQFYSIFSTVFRVPNFQGRFEALNDGQWHAFFLCQSM